MQENVKAAWRERLYASASAVALGCLLPVNGNAGAIDIVSSTLIDPALLDIPRISAPAKWSSYKPELKTETKPVALAVPVPAMAPTPLQTKEVSAATVKRRLSPLEIAWSSQSPIPTPFVSQPEIIKSAAKPAAKSAAQKPTHVAHKPAQIGHKATQAKHKSTQVSVKDKADKRVAIQKTKSVKLAAISSLSSLPPSVAPAAEAAAKSEARIRQKTSMGPITPAVTPTVFKRNGKSPLEVIASLQREEIKVGVLLQDDATQNELVQNQAAQQPEAVVAKADEPATPIITLAQKQSEAAATVAGVSWQDLWNDFDNVQDAVPALEPAAGEATVHLAPPNVAKAELKEEPKAEAKKAPEDIKVTLIKNDADKVQDAVSTLEPAAGEATVHLAPPNVAKTELKEEPKAEAKKVPEDIKVTLIKNDADKVQDAVSTLEPAAGEAAVHLAPPGVAKAEPKAEPKAEVKEAPEDVKSVTQVSLIKATQATALPMAESSSEKTLTYASPLAITSGTSENLWKDFDNNSQPEIKAEQTVAAFVEPAALEPAAGGEPLSLLPPSAPKELPEVKQDLPSPKLLPPAAATKVMTAEEIIAGEPIAEPIPAPGKKAKIPSVAKATLSAESRAVLDSLPPEVRSSNTPKKNVKLDRSNKAGSEEDAVKKHEAYGMKISVKRPKMDVFRMLESAYNSLIAGDQQYAITLYKEVLDEEPDNTLALFGLATTYHRAGQTTLARPLYARLLEIDPHNVEGLNNFLVLLADESPDAALIELEKLRRTHPSFSPVLAQMALIHERRGEYDLAVQKLAQAHNISPENLKYQYNMAIVLDKMKEWPEASKWYQRLLTASDRGEKIPGNAQEIQQRLTFIRSNTSTVN